MSLLVLIVLFVVAAFLRLYNLGYSDYQGDEIKALYVSQANTTGLPASKASSQSQSETEEATSARFFLEQRKGHMQFLVTAGLKSISNDYRNRALVRLPFALAGLGSVVVFFYLSKSLFNEKVALYSTVFFATNGFLIAFSRIVQYQSLVIFFGLLAVYLSKKYADSLQPSYLVTPVIASDPHIVIGRDESERREHGNPVTVAQGKYLIIASISLALSILSHYDGVFFIPIILGLLFPVIARSLFRRCRPAFGGGSNPVIKHLAVSLLVFLILTCAFYIPFVLNIAQSTTDYWTGRISGDVSGKISSSQYLFSVYQPIYVSHIYTTLGIMGFALISILTILKTSQQDMNAPSMSEANGRRASKKFSPEAKALEEATPNIVGRGASQKLSGKLMSRFFKADVFNFVHIRFNQSGFELPILFSVLAWFLIPFILLEVVVSIPGTHIYSYLIPTFLFMGFALFHIDLIVRTVIGRDEREPSDQSNLVILLPAILYSSVCLLFIFLTLQSYYVFVDHTYEYPWENKKFLVWTLPKPTPIFHLSMFGFPYFRHWDEIGNFIRNDRQSTFYTTNERVSISRYHVDFDKDGEKAGYYIYINNPQTFTNEVTNERIRAWVQNNQPLTQYKNQDHTVSKIYLVR